MDKVDITIIGAGVVGLAIAAELSNKYKNKDIVILEKHLFFGQETSSRNSEVVHAGIYYIPGSLKAKLCVEGKKLLWSMCERERILLRKLGKIIIASSDEELKQLEVLKRRGEENGVDDLEIIDVGRINRLEPHIKALVALYSPGTAIIDSHGLMKYLLYNLKSNGAMLSLSSEVTSCVKEDSGYHVMINNGAFSFLSKIVINSAGLYADKIAEMVGIDINKYGYKLSFMKGEYFSYRGQALTNGLVYPTPHVENKTLGIHTVVDIGGGIKFGPNAYLVNKIDYKVQENHKEDFLKAIRTYLPTLDSDDLVPDQAGIRPRITTADRSEPDFIIRDEKDKGLPGFINLLGIESPGLTASLAIAKQVSTLVESI